MMRFEEFSSALLKTGDLDPVYIAIWSSNTDGDTRARLCLAYWCLYHLGAAAKIAEKPKRFWSLLQEAAVNQGLKWPRGAERRHFRGAQAVLAVRDLVERRQTPEAIVNEWCSGGTFKKVSEAVQTARGFGPWISFKIADMAERVLQYSVDFSDCHLGIYKDPRQGAALVRFGDWQHPITDDELRETVEQWVKYWRKKRVTAPPMNDRLLTVQEIETQLCKYKSHVKGHYEVGKDIREVGHGLEGWGDLAQELLYNMPKAVHG